ncbi:hypothetical protein DBV23_17245 [Edwardsiella ictaluri]|uniref:Uncharacterized protein n=1 Tax=Edwardsiella ictaluri TaxID=67780 RepID=A0ABY8GFQ2_EDWIC|nr:hypothetical protein [Edwardsiella ictaluri]ARD38480.1 hypothetical protein B6E78_02830 [Edwardsiella ictaluri]AVZ83770.1 hypothetical protein DBV23_17245 [Edwardsiella ictaluri]EKS7764507.1 hypothetical protein [Edwardsiella ictaluri]EKS7771427.1 hypothetical protein [Edwardsiella ictaluri]EKS7774543.1 hypothetical protein [Edwardsiella ictaluri]
MPRLKARERAIAALIETNFWDKNASPASHRGETCESGTTFACRKRAMLAILRWVQSKREYENIMQHLSTTIGEKGDWKINGPASSLFWLKVSSREHTDTILALFLAHRRSSSPPATMRKICTPFTLICRMPP